MFSLRDLQLLWSSGIPVSSYGMFLHFTYIVHRKVSFRTSHFHTVLLYFFSFGLSSVAQSVFFYQTAGRVRVLRSISAYTMQFSLHCSLYSWVCVNLGNIGTTKAKRTDGSCPFEVANSSVIQISSVDFIEQRVLNLWLYISNKYNVQYRFYLYTVPSSFSLFFSPPFQPREGITFQKRRIKQGWRGVMRCKVFLYII